MELSEGVIEKGAFVPACESALRLSRNLLHFILTSTMLTVEDLESIAKGAYLRVSLLCIHLDGNECFHIASESMNHTKKVQELGKTNENDSKLKVIEQLKEDRLQNFVK